MMICPPPVHIICGNTADDDTSTEYLDICVATDDGSHMVVHM